MTKISNPEKNTLSDKVTCSICGKTPDLIYDGYPGYQAPHKFMIYNCSGCNTSFAFPEMDTSALYENIYKNAYRVPGYNRHWKYSKWIRKFANPFKFFADSSEMYWGVKEALTANVNEDSKILEIGSGLGYLTYSLVKAKYNAIGLELSQTAVDKAKEIFGDYYVCANLHEYARIHEATFDIIILTEVIEHIYRPVEFIASIMKLLKPAGMIIITTPNKSFFPKDIIWATELPPIHYWWFSEESFKYLSTVFNYEISFVNFSRYYSNKYKIVSLESHHAGRFPGPYFNKDGELFSSKSSTKINLKPQLQAFIYKIPYGNEILGFFVKYSKLITGKFRLLFEKDILVCGEKGPNLCAVMKKLPS